MKAQTVPLRRRMKTPAVPLTFEAEPVEHVKRGKP
jgi:hypothetical protein